MAKYTDKWINTTGLDQETFERLCAVSDYLSYEGGKGDFVSITGLNNPVKINMLRRHHGSDLKEDPAMTIWRTIGSSVHDVLERSLVDSSYSDNYDIENRLQAEICGVKVSGMSDVYHKTQHKIIDYKVTSVDKVMIGKFDEWEAQLNGYAYLRRLHGDPVSSLEINAFLRDWSGRKGRFDSNYPNAPIISIPIMLWSQSEQEKYFTDRIQNLLQYENAQDDDIPECNESERWQRKAGVAVLAVSGFKLEDREYQSLVESVGSVAEPLWQICDRYYKTRNELMTVVEQLCGTRITDHEEEICSASGIRSSTASGLKTKRAMRVVDSVDAAYSWLEWKGYQGQWMLEFRQSEPIRCVENYCGVRQYCHYWKSVEHLWNR